MSTVWCCCLHVSNQSPLEQEEQVPHKRGRFSWAKVISLFQQIQLIIYYNQVYADTFFLTLDWVSVWVCVYKYDLAIYFFDQTIILITACHALPTFISFPFSIAHIAILIMLVHAMVWLIYYRMWVMWFFDSLID